MSDKGVESIISKLESQFDNASPGSREQETIVNNMTELMKVKLNEQHDNATFEEMGSKMDAMEAELELKRKQVAAELELKTQQIATELELKRKEAEAREAELELKKKQVETELLLKREEVEAKIVSIRDEVEANKKRNQMQAFETVFGVVCHFVTLGFLRKQFKETLKFEETGVFSSRAYNNIESSLRWLLKRKK